MKKAEKKRLTGLTRLTSDEDEADPADQKGKKTQGTRPRRATKLKRDGERGGLVLPDGRCS